jgi:hypothetical protein
VSVRTTLRFALLFLLAAGARPLWAFQETSSLLAPDGILYVVRSGTAAELGIPGNYARPSDNVISWESLGQDGARQTGMIPGSGGTTAKSNLNLAYDEQSASLILLFREDVSILNILHLGIYRGGQWTVSDLLPNLGFPHAYNPRMLLSHPVVHTIDADGKDVWATRSLVSVIWSEDSNVTQARYAPIFLDEDSSAAGVQVYDLPVMVGSSGFSGRVPVSASAYRYPSLQLEGPGGGILASFADLQSGSQYVVHIGFPTDLGTPGPANPNWLRRHTPIVGIASAGPLPKSTPADGSVEMSTYIGANYNPTLVWHDEKTVRFLRFDGKKWSDVNSITLSDTMSYDRAIRLIQDMATKN